METVMYFEFIAEHLTDDDPRTAIISDLVDIFRLEFDDRAHAFHAPADTTALTRACDANCIRHRTFD
jgi:hypothetical protein